MALVTLDDVLLQLGISETATAEQLAVIQQAIRQAEAAVERIIRYIAEQGTRKQYLPVSDRAFLPVYGAWESSGTQAIYREYGFGGSNLLQVQHIPIRSVTSLKVDYDGRFGTRSGAFGSDTAWTEGTDFWPNWDGVDSSSNPICRDGLIRASGGWPETPGTVLIEYVAGYSAAELAGTDGTINAYSITAAAISEAVRRAKRAFMGAYRAGLGWAAGVITSEHLGDYSYTMGGTTIDDGTYGFTEDTLASTRESLADFVNWGWPLNS